MLGFEQTPVEDDIEDIANEVAVPLNQQHLMVNTQYENEAQVSYTLTKKADANLNEV